MIEFFRVGVKDGTALIELDRGFEMLNRVDEGKNILNAHKEELIVIANELLAVLLDGANAREAISAIPYDPYFHEDDFGTEEEGDED